MRVLIHICCAPCLCRPLEACREEGLQVEGFFYNPNIHPYQEFCKRLKAVKVLAERTRLPVEFDECYGLAEHLERVRGPVPQRCRACYRMRLERTARRACERGFDGFTSSLLVSAMQDHEAIRQIGAEVAARNGIQWVYRDWRGLCSESQEMAKRMSLYRQQYCGCIWSEYERFSAAGEVRRAQRCTD